jgi:hypothetical protein
LRSECPVKFLLSLDNTHNAKVQKAWKRHETEIWFLTHLVAQKRKS